MLSLQRSGGDGRCNGEPISRGQRTAVMQILIDYAASTTSSMKMREQQTLTDWIDGSKRRQLGQVIPPLTKATALWHKRRRQLLLGNCP